MCILFHLWKLKYYVNNRWMSSNFSDDPEIYMLANLVPYLSTTRRVEMWRECSDQRIFPFIKMTTSELLSNGMSLGQNVVGSTNVGALPLLSKIGKVRVLCLQFLPLQIVLSLQFLPLQIVLCLQCLLSTSSNYSLFALFTCSNYLFFKAWFVRGERGAVGWADKKVHQADGRKEGKCEINIPRSRTDNWNLTF